jgi:hypothetical protein
MLRRSSLVECVSVLHGISVYKASIFFLFVNMSAEVNFWDFVRNDNSNKGTTARLNETRFGPKKKSSPIYLGPKNLDTFWCTGWAWNCQMIFRCVSIHGCAGFILDSTITKSCTFYHVCLFFSSLSLYVKKIFISWVC